MAAVPELVVWNVAMQAVNEMGVNLVHHIEGDFCTGLAVGAVVGTHGGVLLARKFAAHECHDFADSFAAGTVGSLHLIEKTPEHDIQREDASAAVLARRRWGEQCLGDIGAKCLAKLRKGAALREFGKSFRESRDRRFSKKQGAKGLKERS